MATDEKSPKPRASRSRTPKPRKPRNAPAQDPRHGGRATRSVIEAPTEGIRDTPASAPSTAWWENPCYHKRLDAYGRVLSDRYAILGRWAQMRQSPDVEVPIGLAGARESAERETVHLPFGAGSRHYAVIPAFTKGQIEHPGEAMVEALLTSLLASCAPDALTIWLIGHRHDLRGEDYVRARYADLRGLGASGPVDAIWSGLVHYWPHPYYRHRDRGMIDWVDYTQLDTELDRREQSRDSASHNPSPPGEQDDADPAMPHLLVLTSYPRAEKDRAILRSALERGPTLGVHVMVIAETLNDEFWQPLSQWCDMVIARPGVTRDDIPGLVEADTGLSSHLVITPAAEDGGHRAVPYEPFLDTGNGLWLPVYGANAVYTDTPVITLSIPADRPVHIHLAATRAHLDIPWPTEAPIAAALLKSVIGDAQLVRLTEVAIVGAFEDTEPLVRELISQLPDDIAQAVVGEQINGTTVTLIPLRFPPGAYYPLPPGSHRIIAARSADELPALSENCYRIDVSAGGHNVVVLHPEDPPRDRVKDEITDGHRQPTTEVRQHMSHRISHAKQAYNNGWVT